MWTNQYQLILMRELTNQQLRAIMQRKLRAVTHATHTKSANRIGMRLIRHNIWRYSNTILSYWPLPGEPDITALHQQALRDGKRLALAHPLRVAEFYIMPAERAVLHWRRSLVVATTTLLQWQRLPLRLVRHSPTLLLIPGLAFDRQGHRLGRGSGWYDRLPTHTWPRMLTVGICYALQLVPSLTHDAHDHAVHMLCSEQTLRPALD